MEALKRAADVQPRQAHRRRIGHLAEENRPPNATQASDNGRTLNYSQSFRVTSSLVLIFELQQSRPRVPAIVDAEYFAETISRSMRSTAAGVSFAALVLPIAAMMRSA